MRKFLSPTNRKRVEFFALCLIGPLGGAIHYDRWPEKSTFGKTRFSGPRKIRR